MQLPEQAEKLSIYIGEDDKVGHRPLYEYIVEEARKQGLAGATVYKASTGYGANSRVHTSKILVLSEDMPLTVVIIDTPEKIEAFLPWIDEHVQEGMVTLEPVKVLMYRHTGGRKK